VKIQQHFWISQGILSIYYQHIAGKVKIFMVHT